MKWGNLLNLASAVAGSAGSLLLFRGSFAYEQFGAYLDDQMIKDQIARNKRRQLFQRGGLALLLLSFLLQGASALAAPPLVSDLIALHDKLDDMCRGWPGSDPHTYEACDAREKTSAILKRMGYCMAYPAYTWHRC